MLRLLERNVAAIDKRLILLAPPGSHVPSHFKSVQADPLQHLSLVQQVQRLRGAVYLDDGAVARAQLSPDGRHQTPEDARSWHLLIRNPHGKLSSCAWYMEHRDAASLQDLRARNCPLARDASTRAALEQAVESELARARRERLRYAEVGGWAVARESRCTAEGVLLALASYSLGRVLGGALGLTTATVRHSSSTILRRLGGTHLETGNGSIGAYFDPHYNCEMELLRFDSRRPSAKYAALIERIQMHLSHVTVVATEVVSAQTTGPVRQFVAA
jgi:hypothetical protein